jgi:endoglucanase
MVYGYPTVGISIPLGNYHNQSFEGGPDSRGELGPAPEFVHWDDVRGMRELCRALLEPGIPWQQPWSAKLKQLRDSKTRYSELLRL